MERLRERRRQELIDQLREISHRHLVTHGAAALSLRAIARDAGISVSALYRYFSDRDDLLTDLLVFGFDAHADAVQAAVDAKPDPAIAFVAGAVAYRRWALSNPAEFGLMYGAPVPGYAAPPQRTIRAGARIGDLFHAVLEKAFEQGGLDATVIAARSARLQPATRNQLEQMRRRRGYGGPLGLTAAMTDTFVAVHGFVVVEVFGQLRPITPDAEPYFEETLGDLLTRLGIKNPGRLVRKQLRAE